MKYFQRKKTIISEKVKAQIVKEPLEVQVLFWKMMPIYDDDIDPLHNPDWVENQKLSEERLLNNAIEEANQFIDALNSWYADANLVKPPSYLETVKAFIDLTDGDFHYVEDISGQTGHDIQKCQEILDVLSRLKLLQG
jgi:hypothetical protein